MVAKNALRALRPLSRILALSALVAVVGCSSGGGGGGAASGGAAGAASGAGTGPIGQKAAAFDAIMPAQHVRDGLVMSLHLDAQGNVTHYGSYGDAAIWTGGYIGSQALRYRVTQDPQALANVEGGLRALHDLQAITNDPGFIARAYAPASMRPNDNPGTGAYAGKTWLGNLSRDQYVGVFFGYALSWPLIQDPALRAMVQQDVRQVAERFMRDDMALRTFDAQGNPYVHFKLSPRPDLTGQITPQNWATIDDFPLNLIAQSMPYDPILAQELERAPWPAVISGDAMHGLMFMKTAALITGDPAIERYYRDVLITRERYLVHCLDNATLLDDFLHGRELQRIETILHEVNHALEGAIRAYLQRKMGGMSIFATMLLQAAVDKIIDEIGDRIEDAILFLSDPARRAQAGQAAAALQLVAQVVDALGAQGAADAIRQVASAAGQVAGTDLTQLADALRSYVGENLFHLSAYALLEVESDAQTRASYEAMVAKHFEYIADERNSFFTYVAGARLAATSPVDPARLAEAKDSLARHPSVMFERPVDNTGLPGIVPSPWPDRFGRVGTTAIDVIPVDQRAPHHWVWQEHPRQIRTGGSGNEILAPTGFLVAYWIGRAHGFVGAAD